MGRRPQRRERRPVGRWIAIGVAALVIAGGAWLGLRPERRAPTEGRITTLVGKPAPLLRFPDADGRVFTVPNQGRPTVLIFHMGLF